MKFWATQTFWVELHLRVDVVLELSRWLVENLFFTKLVDIYHRQKIGRLLHKLWRYSTFINFEEKRVIEVS